MLKKLWGIEMNEKIRILGIAPYQDMEFLMHSVAGEYHEIDLTVYVGDLYQGVELARKNFYNDYDIIVSRGGTATLLRERLDLPVIEIPISPFDILRAMKLAECFSNRFAIVGFPNITASAKQLCDVLQYEIDIYTIYRAEDVEKILLSIRAKGTQAILCDMIAHTTAMQLGLDVVLITSGAEGVRAAFNQSVQLYGNHEKLRKENRFLRSLIWNQINHTVVFNDRGELFFSTVEDSKSAIVEYLSEESKRNESEFQNQLLKQINNIQYSIRAHREMVGGKPFTVYYFSGSRVPLADIHRGIRYSGRVEVEEQYSGSLYAILGLLRELHEKIQQINQTNQPVMVFGEEGTCKEQAVNYMYLHSTRCSAPLVVVDCFLLNDKAWNYLMNHHNSPLTQNECTIFIKNIDMLSPDRRGQLLANIIAMNVHKLNRLIFSCVCRKDEAMSEAGLEFVEPLGCLSLYLPPIRRRAEKLQAMANIYLSHLNTTMAKQVAGFEAEAILMLQQFDWPRNYSQFQRIVKELTMMTKQPYITAKEVEEVLRRERFVMSISDLGDEAETTLDLNRTLNEIIRDIVDHTLERENGNQSRTANRLGISRTTLWRLLREK